MCHVNAVSIYVHIHSFNIVKKFLNVYVLKSIKYYSYMYIMYNVSGNLVTTELSYGVRERGLWSWLPSFVWGINFSIMSEQQVSLEVQFTTLWIISTKQTMGKINSLSLTFAHYTLFYMNIYVQRMHRAFGAVYVHTCVYSYRQYKYK